MVVPVTATEDLSASDGERFDSAFARATTVLAEAGVENPRLDARLLLAAAANLAAGQLLAYPERRLEGAAATRFAAMLARRRVREPVSRILGRREFWSLEFAVAPATLDPRPESETLVEALLARLSDPAAPRALLDLGAGGGCLLLALLSEMPGTWGLGVDLDPVALRIARRNAGALGLGARARFMAADWGTALAGTWDVIVCNPPYVETAEIGRLAPEVTRFDPRCALDGGADGLATYRRVVPHVARLLAPGGLAGLEIGVGQGPAVRRLLQQEDLRVLGSPRDLAGVERCILADRAPGRKPVDRGRNRGRNRG